MAKGSFEAVAAAAKEAGAQWFFSGVLFLMPSSAKQFLPFVRERFPRLARQYEQWYSKNGYAPEEYRAQGFRTCSAIRRKYGFESRPWVQIKPETYVFADGVELGCAGGATGGFGAVTRGGIAALLLHLLPWRGREGGGKPPHSKEARER